METILFRVSDHFLCNWCNVHVGWFKCLGVKHFRIFEIIIFCIVVAILNLLHDVESIHSTC